MGYINIPSGSGNGQQGPAGPVGPAGPAGATGDPGPSGYPSSATTASANRLFGGPASGVPAVASFRVLVSNDIPNLDTAKITTGTLPIARGGSGGTSFPNQRIPFSNGTNLVSDPNFIYDTVNGRLTVGGSGTARLGSVVASSASGVSLQAYSEGTNNCFQIRNQSAFAQVTYTANNNPTLGAAMGFGRSRGTQPSRTQSLNGDTIFNIVGFGHTGSGDSPGFSGSIRMEQTENCTATANGADLIISTTPNGTNGYVDRVRINNSGEAVFSSAIATAQYTTLQKLALTPAAGWVVFDTTLNQLSYYNGTIWVNV